MPEEQLPLPPNEIFDANLKKMRERGNWYSAHAPDLEPEPVAPVQQIITKVTEIGRVPADVIKEKVAERVAEVVPKTVAATIKAEVAATFKTAVESAAIQACERKISADQKRALKKPLRYTEQELGLEVLETVEHWSVTLERLRVDGRLPEAEQFWEQKLLEYRGIGMKRHLARRRARAAVQRAFPPDENYKPLPPKTFESDLDRSFSDILWVFDHLGVDTQMLNAESAPNRGAWSLLGWARKNKTHFYSQMYRTVMNNIATREKLHLQAKLLRTTRLVTGNDGPIQDAEPEDNSNDDMERMFLSLGGGRNKGQQRESDTPPDRHVTEKPDRVAREADQKPAREATG